MKTRQRRWRTRLQQVSLLYLSVWVSSPILAYGTIYRILAVLSVMIWSVTELTRPHNVFIRPTSYLLLLYLFLLYTVPVTYVMEGLTVLNRNIQFYIMIFFLFVFSAYARRNAFEELRPIVAFNIVLFTLWIYTTYRGIQADPHAARYVIKSNDYARQLAQSGVGGFAFIYSLLVYIIGIFALLRHRLKQKTVYDPVNLFLLFSVLFAMLVVLRAGYSLAVMLMFLTTFFYLFYSKNILKNMLLFLGMILIYIIIEYYLLDILKYLYHTVEQGAYRLKIRDAILSYSDNEAVGTVADRIERYSRSFRIFLEHPIFGSWRFEGLGKHSMLLDTFAQFGFFAGGALIYILLKVPFELYRKALRGRVLALTMLLLILLLLSVNNVSMLYGYMFYLFYPYLLFTLEQPTETRSVS